MKRRIAAQVHGWLLLLPAAVLLAAFTHYPAGATLWNSFFSTAKPHRPAAFAGLENYREMANDPVFWQSLVNNAWFALGTIPVSIALALLMAVWVNGKLRGQAFLRLAYFTPTVLPMIAVANIWLFFYTPQYGLLEQLTGLFGLPNHSWLGSRSTALACLIVVTIWKEAGFFMIFYLAALQSVSPALYEAAALEGASRWTVFRRITFPLSLPGVVAGAQICFTLALGAFVTPAMLGGGRVLVLPLQVYNATSEINWPVAAVGGMTLLIVSMIAVAGFNRLLKYSEVR